MREVRIKKDALIKRIKKNRDRHIGTFLKACTGYRRQAITELDNMLNEAKAGKKIRRSVELIEPEDHTRDYDRVLDMLSLSHDKIITLSYNDFTRYVRDEWEWAIGFHNSTQNYTSR